ncbi:DUF6059 family protein [Streptomyces lancefieldiae]|uniref:DUF6059 family protein n=1 Tax=Streptomyces lancefieldiae TaxID=3075520 RepID=UPI00374E010E
MWDLLRTCRVRRAIYRCVVVYGTPHTGPEPGGTSGALRHAVPGEAVGPLTGPVSGPGSVPGPGRPEQVGGDVAFTPLERCLARELESR